MWLLRLSPDQSKQAVKIPQRRGNLLKNQEQIRVGTQNDLLLINKEENYNNYSSSSSSYSSSDSSDSESKSESDAIAF